MYDNLLAIAEKKLFEKRKISFIDRIKIFICQKRLFLNDDFFWTYGLLLDSLSLYKKDSLLIKKFNNFKRKKFKIRSIDDSLSVYVFIKNKHLFNEKDILNLSNNMFSYLKEYLNDIIPYKKSEPNLIYIDTLGMVCPFLTVYAKLVDDEKINEWMLYQFKAFLMFSKDENSNFLYHGFDKKSKKKYGEITWGRGYGWLLFGLSKVIIELETNTKIYKELKKIYLDLINQIKNYQREDGGFSWKLIDINSHLDTSATSFILYSLLILSNLTSDYDKMIKKMMECLKNNITSNGVDNSSCECKGFGNYPQKFGCYIWSLAPTLSSIKLYGDYYE